MTWPLLLRRYLIDAVVVAVVVTGTPWPAAGQVQLDVMTFNVRTSNIPDGDNAWPNRKELVAETIGRSNPHLVGLQEALADQIEYLEGALPQYRWLGVDRALNGGTGLSEATPIFYRYEELIPIESGTFWLGSPPNDRSTRRAGSRRRGAPAL